ncbi:MAG: PKD domain-containing protein [Candidatus Eisenbacteria bacterium]
MRSLRLFLPVLFLVCLAPVVQGQYVFLDANGDGVNDGADQLPATGSADIDIWFVTNENRDGSAATCGTDPLEEMTINSYEIVLRALNGRVAFGPMRNRLPFTGRPVSFAGYEDTTSTAIYHNGWGYRDILPPGRYLVATLTVTIVEGSPSLSFLGRSPTQAVDLTSFGTGCSGVDWDNTYVLGEEFYDASGIGRPSAEANAGGPYQGVVNTPIRLDGRGSVDPDGATLLYEWSFDDGWSAVGAVVFHAFATLGTHTATLTVSSASGTDDDTAEILVVEPYRPIANAGGPYEGQPGAPVAFNGSRSYDPDAHPLAYEWEFGDGGRASGAMPQHIYSTVGEFAVRLTVSDDTYRVSDETTAMITAIAVPENRPPVADAGGPYAGFVGRWIQFDATKSSDPDGGFLTIYWEFGDGMWGAGIVSAHSYLAAGNYTATVTAKDGHAAATAQAAVSIAEALSAEAFLDEPNSVVNVASPNEFIAVRFEPEGAAFFPEEIDPDLVLLRFVKSDGTMVEIPTHGSAIQQDDSDSDGTAEFVGLFPRERFRELRAAEELLGRTSLTLTGGLHRGGSYAGTFEATFVRSNSFDLVVTPNPFNPTAHLILHTRVDGPMSARLFDIRGRRVKTILRGEAMRAGRHDLVFEARDDGGESLASGVYFLQVTSRDGTRTGRVVVAK